MRIRHLLTSFILFVLLIPQFSNAQQRSCFSADYLEQQKLEDPLRAKNLEELERFTNNFIKNNGDGNAEATVYTIPVVFHVVYKTAAENISTAQIMSQLAVLNEDFRRLNANANNNWSQAADSEIEFCLATVDPNGNATSGITRTSTNVTSFSGNDDVKYTSKGGKDAWPAGDYLNYWICNLNGFLGYAQFPGGPPATDGVVCGHQYTGTTGTAAAPFNLGRTGTHEVGHWLNLYHIWGDGPCNQDDLVADTPSSDAENYGCPNGHSSCGSTDMIENYMDYTDDACMNLFTQGQKTRMRALFAPGGFRASLLNSNGCSGGGGGNTCDTPTGLGTANVTNTGATASWNASSNATSYNVQIAVSGSGNWTTANVNGTSHTFSNLTACTSYDVRVQADCGSGNTSNYSSVSTFQTTGCSSGCQDNEVTLTIVADDYPEETTWEIKDGNGTVVASGGPYSSAGATETKALCLPDGCYDFIINDSYGDGICCSFGNGSYSLTEDASGATLASGGSFGSSETTNFCLTSGGGGGGGNCTMTLLNSENFEGGWGLWNDGGSDCRRNIKDAAYANGGSYCVRLRDDDPLSSFVTTDVLDYSSYDELQVDFSYITKSFELNEDFWLQISTDGGTTYTTIQSWVRGVDFNNDERHNESVTISGPFTATTLVRFRCNSSHNGDNVYFDDIEIFGCTIGGGAGCSFTVQNNEDFESGWGIWNDGGSDCRRNIKDAAYANGGSYCVRLRDDDPLSSFVTTDVLDYSSYSDIKVDFSYITKSFELNEDFWLQISTDGGTTYTTIQSWVRGVDFNNDERHNESVTISGPFTSNTLIRFRCNSSHNGDNVYFDDIVISTCSTGGSRNGNTEIETVEIVETKIDNSTFELEEIFSPEMKLFPNPTHSELNIHFSSEENQETHFLISDFSGTVLNQISMEPGLQETRIDVSDWAPGFYLVQMISGEQRISKKFVVAR